VDGDVGADRAHAAALRCARTDILRRASIRNPPHPETVKLVLPSVSGTIVAGTTSTAELAFRVSLPTAGGSRSNGCAAT
jgi:hypothetical protein